MATGMPVPVPEREWEHSRCPESYSLFSAAARICFMKLDV